MRVTSPLSPPYQALIPHPFSHPSPLLGPLFQCDGHHIVRQINNLLNSLAHNLFNPHQRPPMLKYWLSIPLIGITLLLAACSDGPSSSGGVTLYKGGGGPFTLTVENQGGHGAIEVCSNRFPVLPCTNIHRIAVAQGQCGAGVEGCTTTIVSTKSEAADGFKVVWSALNTGTQQSYLATAYTCSPGSRGCTSSKTTHMAKLNANKTQIQTVIKFDANSDTATIGGTFSKDMPETAGVNYCWAGGFVEGNVRATGPNAAACQADINALVTQYGVEIESRHCAFVQSTSLREACRRYRAIWQEPGGSCTQAQIDMGGGRAADDCP